LKKEQSTLGERAGRRKYIPSDCCLWWNIRSEREKVNDELFLQRSESCLLRIIQEKDQKRSALANP